MSDASFNAYGYLKGLGYSDNAVSGILGNLQNESGDSLNTRAIHDSGTGLGIAGWRDPKPGAGRKTNLMNFARERGADVYALKTQLDFLDHELKTSERGVYDRLMKSQSPDEAALAFISFERPAGWTAANPAGGHNWAGRRRTAVDVFNKFSGSSARSLPDVRSTIEPGRVGDNNIRPQSPVTDIERRNAADSVEPIGFFGSAYESAKDASPLTWAFRGMEDHQPDPDFRWSQKQQLLTDLTKDVPRQYWDNFEDATSEAHARTIRDRIKSQVAMQERIGASGWRGTAGAILGEMLEPVGLAASLAIPEAAGIAKLGRMGRILASGATAATANVALEIPRFVSKETAETSDLLWAAGTGMVLGGAFGALRRNPATQSEADALRSIGRNLQQESGELHTGTALGSGSVGAAAAFRPSVLHPEVEAWMKAEAPETALGKMRFDAVGQLKSSQSPVARAVGGKLGLDAVGNSDKSIAVDFAATEYQRHTHTSMMSELARDWQPTLKSYHRDRDIGWSERAAAEAALRKEIAAAIRNTDPTREAEFSPQATKMATTIRKLHARFAELAADPGKLSGRSLEALPGFEQVQSHANYLMRQRSNVRVAEKTRLFGDHAIASAYAKGFKAMHPEVDDAAARKWAEGYVTRLRMLAADADLKGDRAISGQDQDALREMLEEFGTLSPNEVETVLTAVKPKADKTAGASPRAKRRALYDETFTDHLTVTDKADPRYGQTLEFRLMDLFEDDALEVFESYSRQMSGLLGLHQVRVKNPLFTDMHVQPIKRADVEIRPSATNPSIVTAAGEIDLRLERGALVIDRAAITSADPEAARALVEAAADYASTLGHKLVSGSKVDDALAALLVSLKGDWKVHAPLGRRRTIGGMKVNETKDGSPVFEISGEWKPPTNEPEFLVSGLSKQADWERMMQRLAQTWDDAVVEGRASQEQRVKGLELDRQNLDFLRSQVLGLSGRYDQTAWGQALRRLRDYNFIRVMGNVGFAQVNEFFHVAASVGLKASLSAMPAFRHILRDARTGQLNDELARDLEYLTNYGTDWVRGGVHSRIGASGDTIDGAHTGSLGERYDAGMAKLKRATTALSLMAPINTGLQRFAARGVYAKFAHMADGDSVNWDRLTAMGIDKEMGERIFKSIRENRTLIDGGVAGRKLPRMNLESWADQEAASAFQMGVTRWAEYAVLANDPGAMSRVMGDALGKTVLQFRSFVMGAWARHLAHNIHMRDWETATTFLLTGLGGVLTHIAYSHYRYATDPRREERLDKALSWEGLLAGGFQRASWSSFMPAVADTALAAAGVDPVFGYRMTSQPSNLVTGNPTFGLIDDVQKGLGGMAGNLLSRDNNLSQQDVRNVARAFPWGNWVPFVHLMNTFVRELPEYDKRPRREAPERAF
ncbi:phage tail tip lysozyme [Bosea sp. (in: a-proteobacteria)]|uniref:phage tail tip lysozyme n=1 Tax=Bosea sp. (in: a-proteobacteria) TaxID=1871050 RepID=UPI0027332ABB|nr:phage tail tip lysozyme [Bosea sp. (in: a-proteobacteria)]MDP3255374.1 phage tail tip lysozyme [Bosea sp. (in: a-proteobacteria)]